MDFLCHLRSANDAHMEGRACVFPRTVRDPALSRREEVNCFVCGARGAKSLTFPRVPVALIWSHGDLAFSSASSWEKRDEL